MKVDYTLIFGSRLDKAKKFKKWVTSEVLPQIRKTGQYSNQQISQQIDSKFLLQIAEEMQRKENTITQLQYETKVQSKTIQEITTEQNSYGLREVVRKLKVQEKDLKNILKKLNWIMYLKDENDKPKLTYTGYAKQNGYASQIMRLNERQQEYYSQFRITQKGLEYLLKRRNEFFESV